MSVTGKKWIFNKYYEGNPTLDNFKLVDDALDRSNLKDGDLLLEAEYLSVDPYMRIDAFVNAYKDQLQDQPMLGFQVARVIESKSSKFKVGSYVLGTGGWRTHTICNEDSAEPLPELGKLPRSAALGVMGLTGVTSYLCIDRLQVRPGDVILVSSAAGAVGSVAGQIAKLKGCMVIGTAGSQEKLDWLKDLGFDHAINYKTERLDEALTKYAPDGLDCYVDNVGGVFLSTVASHMKSFGRIVVCGCISTYALDKSVPAIPASITLDIMFKQLVVKGFAVFDPSNRGQWPGAQAELLQWITEGKIKYREHVTEGFENMAYAFTELFAGKNIGKAIIKV